MGEWLKQMPTFFDVMFTNIVVDERQTGLAYL